MSNALARMAAPERRNALLQMLQAASNMASDVVAGPVDLLAMGLNKVGVPVGDRPVGGARWQEDMGLRREVPMGPARIAGETAGMLSPIAAAARAPQIAAALNQAGRNLAAPTAAGQAAGQRGAVVWHGSPHKFDRFDSGKIGTGEGAQAYGHGLYLAESPDVAEQYRKALSTYRTTIDGVPLTPQNPNFDAGMQIAARGYDKALADARQAAASGFVDPAFGQKQIAAIEALRGAVIKQKQTGSVYKVDLPDEQIARMLDWDKPLSQQAPGVRDAVQQAFPSSYVNGRFVDPIRSQNAGSALLADLAAIANKRGAPGMRSAEPALRAAGVPGIRYLDGGSRVGGAGSSNFVVFPGEESALRILERNGQRLLFGR